MSGNHQWVSFSKGRIHITGCAGCGQILLPTNEHTQCMRVGLQDNMLVKKGYRIVGSIPNTQVA